jgi:hypothetical protein
MNGALIGGMICSLVVGLAIGTLIGAVILRAAISLYNALVGGRDSSSSVPEPDFSRACVITFVTTLVQWGVGFVLALVMGAGVEAGAEQERVNWTQQLIAAPVSLIVMAALLSSMLPTTFGRALLVSICYWVVVILIVIVFVLIGVVVGFSLAG